MPIHPETISEDRLWPLVVLGATVVTVNRRLARYLFERFTDHQVQSGQAVWKTPEILPYAAFLQKSADRAASLQKADKSVLNAVPLSSAQEQHLWQQIIRQSESGAHLLKIPEAANLAQQAWEIMHAWKIPVSEIRQLPVPETSVFLEWAEIFEHRCFENQWHDSSTLPAALAEMVSSGAASPPETLVMAGFDEFPPREQALLEALSAAGSSVFMLEVPSGAGNAVRCAYAGAASEMMAAAGWARDQVESGAGRIGVIVPDLQARRREIIRIFDDEFHPGLVLSPSPAINRLYNISLGEPLGRLPVIDAAVKILSCAGEAMGVDQYSKFLRSPWIGGASAESSRRAMLDAGLRDDNVAAITLEKLAGRITDRNHPRFFSCPLLSSRLNGFLSRLKYLPERQRPSAWATAFSGLLDTLGWPGDRPLSSLEFQIIQSWKEALAAFCGLDRTGAETDMKDALADLQIILNGKPFQPETAGAPVQIMGVLEAAGEYFEQLWITGMHDGAWPRPAAPNPFLPVWVQRKYDVANSSANREYRFAKMMTERLLKSADNVIVSYPAVEGDAQLFPSPLVTALRETEQPVFENRSEAWWAQIEASAEMEKFADPYGPEVAENNRIRGGTGLLKAQALCPFSAFARYRLAAEGLETPVSGLTDRDRGTMAHRALEYLWQDLASLSGLQGKTGGQLDEVIRCAVDQSIGYMRKKHPGVFTEAFAALEQERLSMLMHEWLDLDRQRSDFFVADREKRIEVVIGGISMTAVADRIDKTDKGLVIIDYKTGTPSESDWFVDRVAEPQLPLYSIMAAEPVAGVLFGQVRRGDSRYRGIAADDGLAPGVRGLDAANRSSEVFSSMEEILCSWRHKIESLADEIRQGMAAVAPVSINKSCRYCDLGPICRIVEAGILEVEDK